MNTKTFAATLLSSIVAISSTATFATEKLSKKETIASTKGAALFTTGAVAGAIAGGPIGMIIGAVGGAFIGEDLKRGARNEDSLEASENVIASYKNQLVESENTIAKLQKTTVQRLGFQVMFTTGDDSLSHQDSQRINSLAGYLKKNPDLKIRLTGHADPRGTDEYNNVLSEERALSVVNALETRGIEKDRISYAAHGSTHSTAYQGDLEAYALERRVNIEVYSEENTIAIN